MPVFRSGPNEAPEWSELEHFEIIELKPGEAHSFPRMGHREKLICVRGRCRITFDDHETMAEQGTNLDLDSPNGQFKAILVLSDATLVRMCGRWGEETGGSGVFGVSASDTADERGDPVDYEKHTSLDNHYHDCDEYWIIVEGRGVAVSEGEPHELGPGDCLATGMGHHHDMAQVLEPITGVYFETTLEGRKRHGHLWDHTHGPAEPQEHRV
jgi:mannose-6-phosphate isomerase-like protein (cupin superfamily)